VARKYDPEVVVRIWRNIRRRGLPTAHVGHAAVTVRGSSFLGDDPYISWWPDWPDDMPQNWRGKFWSVKEVDGFASPNYRIDKLARSGTGTLPLTVRDLARCHTAFDTQNAETRLAALIMLQEHLWTFYQGNRQSPALSSVLALAGQVRDVLKNDMVFA
jgi:hypothetical protein